MIQRSLVLLKQDAIKRGITGEIIHRLERTGLKIIGLKLVNPTEEMAKQHYLTTDDNLRAMGEKTLADCLENNIDPVENMGSDDPLVLGKTIWECNVQFLKSGPIIAMVFEGPYAIMNIRNIVGHTVPAKAVPGTIRGDFALDTAVSANKRKRSIYNLVHASGNLEEAEREINLWFSQDEMITYKRLHEDFYSYA